MDECETCNWTPCGCHISELNQRIEKLEARHSQVSCLVYAMKEIIERMKLNESNGTT